MKALLTAHLLATAGVTDLVGGADLARIHWDTLPAADAIPAVILTKIFTDRSRLYAGRIGQTLNRVQMDCWAATRLEADALRDAVLDAIGGLTSPPLQFARLEGDPPDRVQVATGPDAARATSLYAASLDVQLWHDPNA